MGKKIFSWMRNNDRRFLVALITGFMLIVMAMAWHITRLQKNVIHTMAIHHAKMYTDAFEQVRTIYSAEVVEIANSHGLPVIHDYAGNNNAIPTPTAFSRKLGKHIGKHMQGTRVNLISPYPFPWRQSVGGLREAFDKQAWQSLSSNPGKPYFKFQTDSSRQVLQFAVADTMRESCVNCHNTHPDSPKTGWQAGDVRGMIKVVMPLAPLIKDTKNDFKGTVSIYFLLAMLGVGAILMVMARAKKHSVELEQYVRERTADLHAEIGQHAMTLDKLKAASSYQKTILEVAADGIITIDENSFIETFNQAAQKMFGYAADEVIGKNVSMLLPDDEQKAHEEVTANSALYEPRVINRSRDLEGKRKDGSQFPLELNIAPVATESGKRFVGVMRDITERKKAQQKLHHQKELLNEILSNTNDAYLKVSGDWKIVYANPSSETLLGIKYEDVVNTDLRESLPDVVSMFYKIMRTTMLHKEYKSTLVLYGPTMKYLEAFTCPTSDGLIVYFKDVSERKRVESELIKSKERAEQASQAKSDFLSRMSHELRTPLNAILGYGQLLEMNIDNNLSSTELSNIKDIVTAGQHLLTLINDVLDLSRIERGKLNVTLEPVSLHDVIQSCLLLMHPQAQKKSIEINQSTSDEGYIVCADMVRTKQVLLNLLTNAVKYSPDNSVVTLRVEPVANGRIRINVMDSGRGLTAEEIAKLFTPFERLNEKNNVEGAGIGLVISKHLMEVMHGDIGVHSQPGEGCTFWIELELAQEQDNA